MKRQQSKNIYHDKRMINDILKNKELADQLSEVARPFCLQALDALLEEYIEPD